MDKAPSPVVVLGNARALPLPDCSVDAIVCDPPYELAFMGRSWDSTGVAFDTEPWAEALRVLKPGGHLAAFGASRTYHRVACAIEDAGFEVRDSIAAWVYGSGFPKSLDVSKAVDKERSERHGEALAVTQRIEAAMRAKGLGRRDLNRAVLGVDHGAGSAQSWTTTEIGAHKPRVPSWEQWQTLRDLLGMGRDLDGEVLRLNDEKNTFAHERARQEPQKRARPSDAIVSSGFGADGWAPWVDEPVTDAARAWQGWGTALKPAWEPILLARKPLGGTVAATVLAHGTGAINVDAGRIPSSDPDGTCRDRTGEASRDARYAEDARDWHNRPGPRGGAEEGRWPTNVVLAHHPDCGPDAAPGPCVPGCQVAALDEQSGTCRASGVYSGDGSRRPGEHATDFGGGHRPAAMYNDQGGASRFFPTFRYEAKAPAWQRPRLADGSGFETVKPLDLVRWLVRLLTPPGGLVLDMFPGTGTTGQAAQLEGFRSVLVELEPRHVEFIRERLAQDVMVDRQSGKARPVTKIADDAQGSLFDGLAS